MNRQLQILDRRKLRYEKLFYTKIRNVLKGQTMRAVDFIVMTGNKDIEPNIFFKTSDLQDVFVLLYKAVGIDFAKWQHKKQKGNKEGFRTKQDEQTLSVWEQEMRRYATLAGGRIASITSTNKRLFLNELTKIIGEATEQGLGIEQITRKIQTDLVKRISSQQIWQSRRIAQTEVLSAANQGQFVAAQSSGVAQKKVWMTIMDGKERPTHNEANGQERMMNEEFNVGGYAMQYPGDVGVGAEEVVNCRCGVNYVPIRDEEGFILGVR